MSNTIQPWLKDFLLEEIIGVLNWKKSRSSRILGDEPDEWELNDRYEDNDSSYLITVSEVSPKIKPIVQLIKVVSLQRIIKVLLSDGELTITALLSGEAVATIEEAISDKLDEDLEKDVLQLENFTIIATHEGPAGDTISLDVHSLTYLHTLRKFVGLPISFDTDEAIQRLIEDIKVSREDLDDEHSLPRALLSTLAQVHGGNNSPRVKIETSHETRDILTQASPYVGTQPHQTPSRRPWTSAEAIGRDVQASIGVNLAAPQQAVPPKKELLALLGSKPSFRAKQPAVSAIARTPPPETRLAPESSLQLTTVLTETIRPSRSQLSPVPPLQQPRQIDHSESKGGASRGTSISDTLHAEDVDGTSATSEVPTSRLYNIADDQRALLGKPSSWIPAPPGENAPKWNVPPALLAAWNQAQDALAQKEISPGQRGISENRIMDDTNESEDDSVASWSISPRSQRPDLPPDSSDSARRASPGTTVRPMSSGSMEEAVPHAYPTDGQRMKWLRLTYGASDSPAFDAGEAQGNYMLAFPDDVVQPTDLKRLYALLLSDASSMGYSSRGHGLRDASSDIVRSSAPGAVPEHTEGSISADPDGSNGFGYRGKRKRSSSSLDGNASRSTPQDEHLALSSPSVRATPLSRVVESHATPSVGSQGGRKHGEAKSQDSEDLYAASQSESVRMEILARSQGQDRSRLEPLALSTQEMDSIESQEAMRSTKAATLSESARIVSPSTLVVIAAGTSSSASILVDDSDEHTSAKTDKVKITQHEPRIATTPSHVRVADSFQAKPEAVVEDKTYTKLELFAEHWKAMNSYQRLRDRQLRATEGRPQLKRTNRLKVLSWKLP